MYYDNQELSSAKLEIQKSCTSKVNTIKRFRDIFFRDIT